MESLVERKLFGGIYQGKRVLITGHTGFKGSWLSLWLKEMGAILHGYSKSIPTQPSHFELLNLDMTTTFGDTRDFPLLKKVFSEFKPEIVFHLAAQPIVRYSYREPLETFETNVMGTLNVLEACRLTDSVKAVVCITSDKAYENKEWHWGYRETDELGGKDPYSASKAAAEIAARSFRVSFWPNETYGTKHHILMATTRAGNVIGGGDWAEDRLIPDIIRAASRGETVKIRSPYATRPWEHVLEPLSGYLLVGQKLLEGKKEFATSFNFGPNPTDEASVEKVVRELNKHWDKVKFEIEIPKEAPHEAGLLKLDCSKARRMMGWMPVWDATETFEVTTKWYKYFYEKQQPTSIIDLNNYLQKASKMSLEWSPNNK